MGISGFLTGIVCGAAGVEFIRETWRRMRASADEVKPATVPTMDDLMLESCHHRSELSRIETIVRERVGARPDSNEADFVMHAVRDGHNWQAVLNLERDYLCSGGVTKNRVARWV